MVITMSQVNRGVRLYNMHKGLIPLVSKFEHVNKLNKLIMNILTNEAKNWLPLSAFVENQKNGCMLSSGAQSAIFNAISFENGRINLILAKDIYYEAICKERELRQKKSKRVYTLYRNNKLREVLRLSGCVFKNSNMCLSKCFDSSSLGQSVKLWLTEDQKDSFNLYYFSLAKLVLHNVDVDGFSNTDLEILASISVRKYLSTYKKPFFGGVIMDIIDAEELVKLDLEDDPENSDS